MSNKQQRLNTLHCYIADGVPTWSNLPPYIRKMSREQILEKVMKIRAFKKVRTAHFAAMQKYIKP